MTVARRFLSCFVALISDMHIAPDEGAGQGNSKLFVRLHVP